MNSFSNKRHKDDIIGVGWSFPIRFEHSGNNVRSVMHEQLIEASVILILSTVVGERMANPTFGSDLQQMMFNGVNRVVTREVVHRIKMSLLEHEPRIDVSEVRVRGEDSNAGRIDIHIAYIIRTTNTRYNMVYPLYLEQVSV